MRVRALSRDTTDTNGTVTKTPDVNGLLDKQSDMMGAAGQAVVQGIGQFADYKRDTATDAAMASAWDEGGDNRTMLHIAGGALIGGLGGGAFDAFGGAVGAGLASGMAKELDRISNGVTSATGSPLIGNLAENIVAGLGGAVVGGTAGASTGSAVELYNQKLDLKKNALSQVCNGLSACAPSLAMAVVNANGASSAVAADTMQTGGKYGVLYGAPAAAVIALGPEAVAAAGWGFVTDFSGATYSYATGQSKDAPASRIHISLGSLQV